ncbi:MAG TPA: transaldolase [Burkholderiales bacterium]|nr:transaldolase [Burkholderiales bacterium]
MASLLDLARHGQSVWLDFIDRNLVARGGLQRLVDSGVTGVTTNPSIFNKAIGGSRDYDEAIRELLEQNHEIDPAELCEALMVGDVQMAADVLRPIYDRTRGRDGYVSLEVPPDLAYSIERTVASAGRLWAAVDRPNVMIKVPGTPEGVRAFERLTATGINVNVTLLFAVSRYEEVVWAWARGLARNAHPENIASVASFFVSRVDTKADKKLDASGAADAGRLRGRIAVANAKAAYQRFQELLKEPEVAEQLKRGARPQRPLWASTSTKDPSYSDVLYVESLIGPDTVNTLPPETLDAFLYHGEASYSLEADTDVAQRDLEALKALGVDLDAITRELESEGVASFRESWDKLLAALKQKCFLVTKDFAGH